MIGNRPPLKKVQNNCCVVACACYNSSYMKETVQNLNDQTGSAAEGPKPVAAGGLEPTSMARRKNETPVKATRFKGIGADAQALGVSRAHLWRVLAGRFVSYSLSQRYAVLKVRKSMRDENQPSGPPDQNVGIDPADVNLNWSWIGEVLAKLGISVLIVASKRNAQKAEWPHVGNLVGRVLESRQLGRWDSGKLGDSTCWYFYVSSNRLAEALPLVKGELEARRLLAEVTIAVADHEAKTFRIFWPELEKAGT